MSRQEPAAGNVGKPSRGQRRPPRRALLGELLIRERLISPSQLQDALRIQADAVTCAPLGQTLVEHRIITQDQLNAVLDRYEKKSRLGDILVETEAITGDQLGVALERQEGTGRRLGDVLTRLNFATETQVKRALARQLEVTFVDDFDAVAIERRLANLLRRDYAAQLRIVPISMTKDRITVAMDDPTDTEVIDELELCTSRRVEVLTSTSAAFERAFARAYEEASEDTPSTDAGKAPEPETAEAGDGDLMRWGPPGSPAWAGLRGECEAIRAERDALLEDRDTAERARRELEVRYAEAARRLAELEAAHEALRQQHAAALAALHRGAAGAALPDGLDREGTAGALEAVLRRLKT